MPDGYESWDELKRRVREGLRVRASGPTASVVHVRNDRTRTSEVHDDDDDRHERASRNSSEAVEEDDDDRTGNHTGEIDYRGNCCAYSDTNGRDHHHHRCGLTMRSKDNRDV